MKPVRQILDNAPAMIPVPEALRHKRLELIFWPVDDAPDSTEYEGDGNHVSTFPLNFRTMKVRKIIMPSLDERYVR